MWGFRAWEKWVRGFRVLGGVCGALECWEVCGALECWELCVGL